MSEDSFPFGLEQDSLANSLGAAIPNRSLMIVEGEIGGGKSLIAQRLAFGLSENGTKVALVTTELTTRGWLEQVNSIGYGMSDYIDNGQFLLMSRFGVLTEEVEVEITINDLLTNEGLRAADFVIIDRASQLIPLDTNPSALLSAIRRFTAEGRTLMLCFDSDEVEPALLKHLPDNNLTLFGHHFLHLLPR